MKIPSQVFLLGHKWEVRILPKAEWPYGDQVGSSDFQRLKIEILEGPQSFMEHSFYHELLHAALDYMGQDKLSKDESFVDLLAGLIHQAMTLEEGQ